MHIETQVVKIISDHMNTNWKRVAGILSGPRREGWFNSESFVAVCENVNPLEDGGFSVYGEESFKTILANIKSASNAGNSRKIPDIVGYWPHDVQHPAFILEAKLVFVDEDTKTKASLNSLKEQLNNANEVFPTVPLIGLVFIASTPSPNNAQPGISKINDLMEQYLPAVDGYSWVNNQRSQILPNLDHASPGWESFNVYSTLAIGARFRSQKVTTTNTLAKTAT